MIPKSLVLPTMLVASVGVPYVASNGPGWSEKWRAAASAPAAESAAPSPSLPAPQADAKRLEAMIASPSGPGSTLYPTPTPLEGAPTYSLAEVFRLDITKEWVYQRWPRKSTALSSLDLFGVRVPLVTGTKLYDLAGSLTYFFGVDGRVQRISFRGRTGDTTQLMSVLAQGHGMRAYPTAVAGEQLLQLRRGDDVICECRTRPAAVLWTSSPHDSFSVELELQNPATARPLKPTPFALPPVAASDAKKAAAPPAAADAKPAAVALPEPPAAVAESTSGIRGFFSRLRPKMPESLDFDRNDMYR